MADEKSGQTSSLIAIGQASSFVLGQYDNVILIHPVNCFSGNLQAMLFVIPENLYLTKQREELSGRAYGNDKLCKQP